MAATVTPVEYPIATPLRPLVDAQENRRDHGRRARPRSSRLLTRFFAGATRIQATETSARNARVVGDSRAGSRRSTPTWRRARRDDLFGGEREANERDRNVSETISE